MKKRRAGQLFILAPDSLSIHRSKIYNARLWSVLRGTQILPCVGSCIAPR